MFEPKATASHLDSTDIRKIGDVRFVPEAVEPPWATRSAFRSKNRNVQFYRAAKPTCTCELGEFVGERNDGVARA